MVLKCHTLVSSSREVQTLGFVKNTCPSDTHKWGAEPGRDLEENAMNCIQTAERRNGEVTSVARAGTNQPRELYFREVCPRKLPTLLKSEDDLLLE